MPDPHRLMVLTDLRKAAGITLARMAHCCGLIGRKSHESASAWERGLSVPHARLRPKFLAYLWRDLGLCHDPTHFYAVWTVLVEEWGWEALSARERQEYGLAPLAPSATATPTPPHRTELRFPATLPNPAPLPPGSHVPFSRNPHFVGRQFDLHALAAVFQPGSATSSSTTAITGLGGIGKTQLAVEFVHRYGNRFPGGVFWLNCTNPSTLPQEIAACGGAAHMALHPDFECLPCDEQLRLVLEEWQRPLPRLLIFDNCEDPELIARWRPIGGGCQLLITSRRASWDAQLEVWALPLETLSRKQSVALLHKYRPDLSSSSIALTAIAAELGDLPLALHLAGSFLAYYAHSITPIDYLEELRSLAILAHPSLQSSGFSPTGHPQHVARTFALSYNQLDPTQKRDRLALTLLNCIASLSSGTPIPRNALLRILLNAPLAEIAAATVLAIDEALLRLIDLGLLEAAAGPSSALLRMHRLVAAFVRQTAPNSVDARKAFLHPTAQVPLPLGERCGLALQSLLWLV